MAVSEAGNQNRETGKPVRTGLSKFILLFCLLASAFSLLPSPVHAACTGPDGDAGAMLYNRDHCAVQYCDGSAWKTTTLRSDSCPFGFNDVERAVTSTVIESNIVQVSLGSTVNVSISGDGSPEFRICTDGSSEANCDGSVVHNWGSAAQSIDDGEYLQLRLTSSASDGTLSRAEVRAGPRSESWDVKTSDPCSGSPAVGTECEDGSYYIGQVGGNDIYATSAAHESSESWNNGTFDPPWTTTGLSSVTDGPGNTAGLVALGDAGSPYDAAVYCDGLINVHGHSDWYLPAKDELNLLWNGGSPIAGVLTDGTLYWSATENSHSNGWWQRFSDGTQLNNKDKSNTYAVRCARRD